MVFGPCSFEEVLAQNSGGRSGGPSEQPIRAYPHASSVLPLEPGRGSTASGFMAICLLPPSLLLFASLCCLAVHNAALPASFFSFPAACAHIFLSPPPKSILGRFARHLCSHGNFHQVLYSPDRPHTARRQCQALRDLEMLNTQLKPHKHPSSFCKATVLLINNGPLCLLKPSRSTRQTAKEKNERRPRGRLLLLLLLNSVSELHQEYTDNSRMPFLPVPRSPKMAELQNRSPPSRLRVNNRSFYKDTSARRRLPSVSPSVLWKVL